MKAQIRIATDLDFHHWSYGRVSRVEDLYSQAIFGAAGDLQCACAKLQGPTAADRICTDCGVKVVSDSAHERRSRMGHIDLGTPVHPPLSADQLICEFPILPVFYRVDSADQPNDLGAAYEQLILLAAQLHAHWPNGGYDPTDANLRALRTQLDAALKRIVIGDNPASLPGPTRSRLLDMLAQRLLALDQEALVLLKSAGLTIDIQAGI